MLGPLEVRRNGRVVPLHGHKQRALLALLLLGANEVVSRERLIDELWSDQPPETATNTLQVHVSQLRKALAGDGVDAAAALATRPPGYVLFVLPDHVDADRFKRQVAAAAGARRKGEIDAASALLTEALGAWRGPALADLASEPFARPEIARLEELRLAALEDRIDCELELGHHAEVVGEIEALVEQHPLRERLRLQLMLALYRSDRQADALGAYHDARTKLNDELGIAPSQALSELQRSILRQDETIAVTRPSVARPRKVSLPDSVTPLVGRTGEIGAVVELVRLDHVRLVTLTGLGGIGKTRLAAEAARLLAPDFPDGVAYVPLATISDPGLLSATMAQTLGVGEWGGPPEEALEEYLRPLRMLLLADNFEQLVTAADLISRLLSSAPGLKVLVTSRAPLRLAAEHEYALSPLPVADSIALFAERAQAVSPDFSLSGPTAGAVGELCERLEGLPLAIELAAARTRLLSPAAMLNRLDRRLDLLAAGPRDVPGRHRALRLTLDWSFELLTPAQQRVFARLAVFVGGCALDAAAAVCGVGDASVLDDLSPVVEESLVRQVGESRFAMLETVREYAAERLRALGEDDDARAVHSRYFLGLAEDAHQALGGPQQAEWLGRLELEHDNLRAAQTYARERGDSETSLRLCASLWRFWQIHGHLEEGRRALENALASDPGGDSLLRARALNGAGVLAGEQGDFEAAASFFETALELVRGLGDHERTANVLVNLGNLALFDRDFERARRLYEDSIEHAALGGSSGVEAIARENLGLVALDQGDLDHAVELLEESTKLAAEAGDDRGRSSSTRALAAALLEGGETERARDHLGEGLDLARRLGELNGIAYCLDTFAGLAAAARDAERAAQLFGAADAVRSSIGALRPPDQQPLYERWVASTLTQLETAVYAACYESGRALSLDDACELALALPGIGIRMTNTSD
ncbi:MAG: BTAD domain-containing putative transcriptional regulator [Gaiellaceae bacterium]